MRSGKVFGRSFGSRVYMSRMIRTGISGPRSICRSKSEVVVAQVAQLAFSSVNGPLKPLGMMCSWLVPGEPQ